MDPKLRLLSEFIAITVIFAFAWHMMVRHFSIASILSGASTGLIFGLVFDWGEPWSIQNFALSFAIFGAPAVIISFGIGIPFNRRRKPLPSTNAPTGLRPVTSFTQRLSWHQVVAGIVMVVVLLGSILWRSLS